MATVITKTPIETLDVTLNWLSRLGTDTISASSWSSSSSQLTVNSPAPTNTTTTTTVWIGGGIAGQFYTVTNTITTVGGREYTETFTAECLAVNTL